MDLIQGVQPIFGCWDPCREVDGGNELWLVPIPHFKGGFLRRAMLLNIVREFHEWDQLCPIVLLEIAEHSKVLLELLIDSLGLAIRLWMERGGHGRLDVKFAPNFLHHF